MVDMNTSLQLVARLFKTLSDPTRLQIIRVLTLDCQSVSAIVEATGFSQPLVSHHLSILRERGLVRAEPRDGYTYY
jgi:DNA-binding transcriptional ArsR family regulator